MAIGFAGTSIADIEAGAEGALEEDIANMSPASNSVAANLDGGVAAVDWASKTQKKAYGNIGSTGTEVSVSGSGYLLSWYIITEGTADQGIYIDGNVAIDLDTSFLYQELSNIGVPFDIGSGPLRFDTSWSFRRPNSGGGMAYYNVNYVLD